MSPQDLLFWVEQIPQIRQMPEFKKFTLASRKSVIEKIGSTIK